MIKNPNQPKSTQINPNPIQNRRSLLSLFDDNGEFDVIKIDTFNQLVSSLNIKYWEVFRENQLISGIEFKKNHPAYKIRT